MAANNYEKGGKKGGIKNSPKNPVKLLYDDFIHKNKSANHFIYQKIFIIIWAFQIRVTFD